MLCTPFPPYFRQDFFYFISLYKAFDLKGSYAQTVNDRDYIYHILQKLYTACFAKWKFFANVFFSDEILRLCLMSAFSGISLVEALLYLATLVVYEDV